jgi:hypothetical protein
MDLEPLADEKFGLHKVYLPNTLEEKFLVG